MKKEKVWRSHIRLLKRCFLLAKESRRHMAVSLVYAVLGSVVSVASGMTLKYVVDIALKQKNIPLLWWLQGIFILTVLLSGLFGVLGSRVSAKITGAAQGKIRRRMFDHLLHLDYMALQNLSASQAIYRINDSVDALEGVFTNGLITALSNVFSIVITVSIMFVVEWRLTLISLVVFPFLIRLTSLLNQRLGKTNYALQEARSDMTDAVGESFACYNHITSHGLKEKMLTDFEDSNQRYQARYVRQSTLFSLVCRASWSLVMVPYQALLYGVGGTLAILNGYPTIGTLLIFANFTNYLVQPVMQLVNSGNDIVIASNAFGRIDAFLALPERKKESYAAPKSAQNLAEMENMDFVYPEQHAEIFSRFSCAIPLHQTTVLWGKSGSGKSTLLKLLAELLPIEKKESLRKIAAERWPYFPQAPVLPKRSIRDNFLLVNDMLSDEEIWEKLKAVRLDGVIREKSEGLDSVVNQNESLLSIGEYRRLCLAVFLAGDDAVLLMDEPSASLDARSASAIADALRELAKSKKTVVIATHDPALKSIADTLIPIEKPDGRAKEKTAESSEPA